MQLLTIEDLADRWKMNKSTINNYLAEGLISRVEGIKSVRFNPRHIEAIEGKLDERKTWREIELEQDLENYKREIQRLNGIIGEAVGYLSSSWRGKNGTS